MEGEGVSVPIERRVPNLLLEWRMKNLEDRVDRGFDKIDKQFEKQNERFDQMENRTIGNLVAFVIVLVTIIAGFVGTIVTLLTHR